MYGAIRAHLISLAIISFSAFWYSDAAAQEDDGESLSTDSLADMELADLLNIVVSATKTAQRQEEAPATVRVVTRRDIKRLGYRSLADILNHTPGFYVVDDFRLPNVGVRGVAGGLRSESGTIKVMIDGRSVAYGPTGGNWIGPELIPLSIVERIEIILGPASTLYGADAFLGVVNIITRSGGDDHGATAWLGAHDNLDSWGYDQDFSADGRIGNLELMAGFRQFTENLSGLPLPETSPAPNLPSYHPEGAPASGLDQQSYTGFGGATYHLGSDGYLRLTGNYSRISRGLEFAELVHLSHGLDNEGRPAGSRDERRQAAVGLSARYNLTDDLELFGEASHSYGRNLRGSRIENGSSLFYVRPRSAFSSWQGELGLQWEFLTDLTVVLAASAMFDRESLPALDYVLKESAGDLRAGERVASLSTPREERDFVNTGAQLLGIYRLYSGRLNLSGGLRFDYHNIYGAQLSGRAAAVWSPISDLYLKLLYGNAFKAPSPFLLHAVPSRAGDIIGNEGLRPQFIHSIEATASYALIEELVANTSVSYNILLNKTAFTLRGLNQNARNVAEMGSLAWESWLELHWQEYVRAELSASFAFGERSTGFEGYYARVIGNGNPIYPEMVLRAVFDGGVPWSPVRLAIRASYVGTRGSSDTNSIRNGATYSLPAYVMLDAFLTTRPLELSGLGAVKWQAGAYNLLDVEGPDAGFGGIDYPLRPLTWLIKAMLHI